MMLQDYILSFWDSIFSGALSNFRWVFWMNWRDALVGGLPPKIAFQIISGFLEAGKMLKQDFI